MPTHFVVFLSLQSYFGECNISGHNLYILVGGSILIVVFILDGAYDEKLYAHS